MQCRVVDYLRCKSLYVRSCHKLSKPYQEFFGNYVFCRIWWTSSFVDVKSRTHRSSFLRYSMDNYFGNTNRHFQLISQDGLTVEIATNFNKIEKIRWKDAFTTTTDFMCHLQTFLVKQIIQTFSV